MFLQKLSGKPLRFYLGLGLMLMACGFAWRSLIKKISPIQISGTSLKTPVVLPNVPFKSSDPTIKEFHDLQGAWSVVFFGYATCPTICPTALGQMAKTLEELQMKSGGKNLPGVRMVFVTLDPDNDSMEQMSAFARKFNPQILSVNIEQEHLKELTRMLGVTRLVASPGQPSTVEPIVHSGDFFLLNPHAEWFALYRPPIAQGVLAQDLFRLSKTSAKF